VSNAFPLGPFGAALVIYLRRLTVPLAVMIAFYLTVINHLGNGPVWKSMIGQRYVDFCTNNWWQAITYVNNYVGIEKVKIINFGYNP